METETRMCKKRGETSCEDDGTRRLVGTTETFLVVVYLLSKKEEEDIRQT